MGFDIINGWFGFQIGCAVFYPMTFQHLCDLAVRIVQISKTPRLGRACDNTGGFHALLQPMSAEIALHRRSRFDLVLLYLFIRCAIIVYVIAFHLRENLSCAIRAGDNAFAASDAFVFIDEDQSILPFISGFRWAYGETIRILAMMAAKG